MEISPKTYDWENRLFSMIEGYLDHASLHSLLYWLSRICEERSMRVDGDWDKAAKCCREAANQVDV